MNDQNPSSLVSSRKTNMDTYHDAQTMSVECEVCIPVYMVCASALLRQGSIHKLIRSVLLLRLMIPQLVPIGPSLGGLYLVEPELLNPD